MTSDNILIVNEDICLSNSTTALTAWRNNTSAKSRLKQVQINDVIVCANDYVIPEFTLSEIKTLKRV